MAIWLVASILYQLLTALVLKYLYPDRSFLLNFYIFMLCALSIFLPFVIYCLFSSSQKKRRFAAIAGILYGILQAIVLLSVPL